jgi:CRP-like cAMP-binding protein
MDSLLRYLESISSLSETLRDHLIGVVKTKTARRKEFILKSGQVCSQVYFISRGLLRCFYVKNMAEVCSWFMKEGDIAISIESFFEQKPSYENIQALEETDLLYISYQDLQFMYLHFPEFNFIGRVLTEKYYTLSEKRLFSMRMQRANERYDYLSRHSPELLRRVSASQLASYLGITMETLSRLKSRR